MIYVKGMKGLGDNIYQRSFITQLASRDNILLETPWPELYDNINNISFIRTVTTLRTQNKNIERNSNIEWVEYPSKDMTPIRINYANNGIIADMSKCFGITPGPMELPDWRGKYQWITDLPKFALVRPVTVRREWKNTARNPLPEYVAEATRILKSQGYYIISIADICANEEWALDPMPESDLQFHAGELNIKELMALVNASSMIVAGVGWIVPAAIAYDKKAWIVLGGCGDTNHPDKIGKSSKIGYAKPDNYCICDNPLHECDKVISDHENKFVNWLKQ